MSFSEAISYTSAASLSFDSTVVEVASNTLRLKDLGGGTYSTVNPFITTQHANMATTLTSFAESSSVSGSDAIQYQIVIGENRYYFNLTSSLWTLIGPVGTVSVNDYANGYCNLASDINSNLSTLVSGLSLTGNFYFSLIIFLHSASGSSRPTLTSNTWGYTFTNLTQTSINQCTVTAYLSDILGAAPTYNSAQPTTLLVRADTAFYHGTNLVIPFTQTATFNSSGVATISVIETATPAVPLYWSVTYYEGVSKKTLNLGQGIVPDQSTASLPQVAIPDLYDFG